MVMGLLGPKVTVRPFRICIHFHNRLFILRAIRPIIHWASFKRQSQRERIGNGWISRRLYRWSSAGHGCSCYMMKKIASFRSEFKMPHRIFAFSGGFTGNEFLEIFSSRFLGLWADRARGGERERERK